MREIAEGSRNFETIVIEQFTTFGPKTLPGPAVRRKPYPLITRINADRILVPDLP